MSVEQEILVTGIKVVDLLAPYAKGGKIGMISDTFRTCSSHVDVVFQHPPCIHKSCQQLVSLGSGVSGDAIHSSVYSGFWSQI